MQRAHQLDPFILKLILLDDKSPALKQLGLISSTTIFESSSRNFHSDGLYSTEIFGKVGTETRKTNYGIIDLKLPVIHPTIYTALTQAKELHEGIMSKRRYAIWDAKDKCFVESDVSRGETGMVFFLSHVSELKLPLTGSDRRINTNTLLDKYRPTFTYTKLIVIPAFYRDMEIDPSGKPSTDDINGIYSRIIALSNLVDKGSLKFDNTVYNGTSWQLQMCVNELYEYLKDMIDGKKKAIQGHLASRNIHHGTRNTITVAPQYYADANSPKVLAPDETVMGMYQFLKATLPLSIFTIQNGIIRDVLGSANSQAMLINKVTLHREQTNIDGKDYDKWMSAEGLEKTITRFANKDIRHLPLEIANKYVALVYRDDKNVMVLYDIDDLPPTFDKAKVSPITVTELYYMAIYKLDKQSIGWVTRYPITGQGSIYPSRLRLKTNTISSTLRLLDKDGNPTETIFYEYPTKANLADSMSPATARLGGLNADFDGDQTSGNVVLSVEAIEEAEHILGSVTTYVDGSGEPLASVASPTLQILLDSTTGD